MELYFKSQFSVYFKDVQKLIEYSFVNLNYQLVHDDLNNNEAIYRLQTENDVFFFILSCPHANLSRDAHFEYKLEINSNNHYFDCFSFCQSITKFRELMTSSQLQEFKKMAIF